MLRRAHNSMPLAAGPAGEAPKWVQLLPAGTFTGRDGAGPYSLDDPQAVIDATLAAAAGADLPIDYDHQTLWSRDNGQPAIAGGWLKAYEAREDGVWARVDWTPTAAARIAAREYRYLSPVFWHDAAGRIIRVEHAALTNTPNLELEAIASRSPNGGEMDPKQFAALLAALGLPADTKPEQLAAHAKTLADLARETGQTLAVMAKRLGLPEDAKVIVIDQALAGCLEAVNETAQALGETGPVPPARLAACAKALMTQRGQGAGPDPAKFVPTEQFQAVASRLKALEDAQATEKATTAVAAAMEAGKVIPSTKEWAMDYASRDPAGFAAYVAAMPAIVNPGQEGPGGRPPATAGQIDEAGLAVCSQLGLSAEDYKRNIGKEVG
ncbi:MAG: phage protease [Solidesulfovibrio sp. DCME]|uniref:phage protease n=1 Tax=Solidesulfovibrio sp. DCME TaxID=3447380 RepID=UPI003D11A8C3